MAWPGVCLRVERHAIPSPPSDYHRRRFFAVSRRRCSVEDSANRWARIVGSLMMQQPSGIPATLRGPPHFPPGSRPTGCCIISRVHPWAAQRLNASGGGRICVDLYNRWTPTRALSGQSCWRALRGRLGGAVMLRGWSSTMACASVWGRVRACFCTIAAFNATKPSSRHPSFIAQKVR